MKKIFLVEGVHMQQWRFLISLAVAWGIGVSIACAGGDILGSFFGVFVGLFTCFTLIVALSHLLMRLLPKFGFDSDWFRL